MDRQDRTIIIDLEQAKSVSRNERVDELVTKAILRGEGRLDPHGALCVTTGTHTGRAASDKYIVEDATTNDTVWWDANKKMSRYTFDLLLDDFNQFAKSQDLFVQDLYAGAQADQQINARIVTQFAWQALFIRNLLIRPSRRALKDFAPNMTIICLPEFKADPERHGTRGETVIACDFSRNIVLIGGTHYAGEIKKSVFTLFNFHAPADGILPMHCSANVGSQGDVAIFFGLSGTGKTTLSADANRTLIGDDEHGWSKEGVFNLEGGCYAKAIDLTQKAEPEIFAATQKFGVVLENVVLDEESGIPDFHDKSLTENTRCAYPLFHIANASRSGRAGTPQNIILLTADAFGVLPPIARLNSDQALYHFLSGYTAKLAGTEKGVVSPQATFSACFGAPFMPRNPNVYGELLKSYINKNYTNVWLLNTGWTGGAYGTGKRIPLVQTRAMLSAALDGSLHSEKMRQDPLFGFEVPLQIEGVETALLNPRDGWADPAKYDAQAANLVDLFNKNFEQFASQATASTICGGPVPKKSQVPHMQAAQ